MTRDLVASAPRLQIVRCPFESSMQLKDSPQRESEILNVTHRLTKPTKS